MGKVGAALRHTDRGLSGNRLGLVHQSGALAVEPVEQSEKGWLNRVFPLGQCIN